MLASNLDIAFARILFKDFGVPFYKPTLFLHNTPTLPRLQELVRPWVGETVSLRGKILLGGTWVFCTQLAEPYPPALGAKYGELMAEAFTLRQQALALERPVPFADGSEGYRLHVFWCRHQKKPKMTWQKVLKGPVTMRPLGLYPMAFVLRRACHLWIMSNG